MRNSTASGESDARTLVMVDEASGGNQRIRVRRAKLLVLSGPQQGSEVFVNKDRFSIGSGRSNDLVINDSTISRRHCEIEVEADGYAIRDLDSTNGTLVQGVRITSAFLHTGSDIRLGKTRMVFCPLRDDREVPLSENKSFGKMLGGSVAMRRVFHLAETYAPTEATLMISGETGTGKEVLAEEIHRHSPRRDRPFIVIDCASLARDLIESELFGHVKGSFTGARTDREGAFEHASGGTVFLDEIGDLSADLQPKLLRVLEKREIRRVGSNQVRKIDVRVICATNRRLDVEVNEGRFREDLFYRLSVVNLDLPPLRHRKDDIPMLAMAFMRSLHGPGAEKQVADWSATTKLLQQHDWPGNVRELRNLIEVAFYGAEKRPVELSAFLGLVRLRGLGKTVEGTCPFPTDRPFKEAKGVLIDDFEKNYIRDLLERNQGNISASAREAGIERSYLQRLMRKHEVDI